MHQHICLERCTFLLLHTSLRSEVERSIHWWRLVDSSSRLASPRVERLILDGKRSNFYLFIFRVLLAYLRLIPHWSVS